MFELELVGRLAVAGLLASAIGLERELRQKHAGLRTHALVGLGAAVMIVVSEYGFQDVLQTGRVVLDPSRVAAQVVSGIGFIGGGLIFVRQASVRGLTTAASVWLAAGIGLAAGAGLYIVAAGASVLGLFVVEGFEQIERRLPRSNGLVSGLHVRYIDGGSTLHDITARCRQLKVEVAALSVAKSSADGVVEATLYLRRTASLTRIAEELAAMKSVVEVRPADADNVD